MVPELGDQCRPAPGDARLHRSDGDAEHVGDLGVPEAGDVAQHDRGAKLLGQRGECLLDSHPVDDGVDVAVRDRIVGLELLARLVADDLQVRPAFAAAELVEGGVGGDPVGPRAERRSAVEAIERANDADHRVLGGVVGIAGGADDARAHGVDAVEMPAEQFVEGATVAALGGGDERLVVGAGIE